MVSPGELALGESRVGAEIRQEQRENGEQQEEKEVGSGMRRRKRRTKNKRGDGVDSGAMNEEGGRVGGVESLASDSVVKVKAMVELIKEMYPEEAWDEAAVGMAVEESIRTADREYGEEEAREWGEGFEWPQDIGRRDETLARDCGYNLAEMARRQHAKGGADRLSRERVNAHVPLDDPDRARMESLVEGMQVLTEEGFQPNGEPPRMRSLYKKVKKAVNKVLADMWKEELVFVVSKGTADRIAEECGGIQYNAVSWARKKDKKQGRNICDSSDNSTGSALNGKRAKELMEEMYGKIEHPNLDRLVSMVNAYTDRMQAELGNAFQWDDLRLWKADLRKAFTLLDVRDGDVRYFACELTDGLVLFYHTGLFGWTGTPYCFQVITRVIKRLVNARIQGNMEMFVDDGMAVGMVSHVCRDKAIMKEISEGIMGSKAMAEDKWEEGTRQTWTGWDLDLTSRRVTISRRNLMKTLYGFFMVEEDEPIQVCEIERLASWASRYTQILRVLEPFTRALYDECVGMHNRLACKRLRSIGAKVAIWMWRGVLCLLHLNEETFARTFDSFRPRTADVLLEYDASLTGLGLRLVDLRTGKHIGSGGVRFPFAFGSNSRWQNTAEFIAVVVGCACLARAGYRGVGIKLMGDNMSSLQWGGRDHFSSRLCFKPTLLYIMLSVAMDFRVVETHHLEAALNWFCDGWSRGSSAGDMGVPAAEVLDLKEASIFSWLEACDPTTEIESKADFLDLWKNGKEGIKQLTKPKAPRKRKASDWMG